MLKLLKLPQLRLQRGVAAVEFALIGPIMTFLGLAILQYALLFYAKNLMNHATFMTARAGSVAHADRAAMQTAYAKALIPLYGGGRTTQEIKEAYIRAMQDIAYQESFNPSDSVADVETKYRNAITAGKASVRIELLNPTRQSYDDFSNPELTAKNGGNRTIPNAGQNFAYPAVNTVLNSGPYGSGQTLQDANLIKIRVLHGYKPKVWMMRAVYKAYLLWLDPGLDVDQNQVSGSDVFHTQLIRAGLVPVLSYVTLEMQSDPIEDETNVEWNARGPGNNGTPVDPGNPVTNAQKPPNCVTAGCTVLKPYIGP